MSLAALSSSYKANQATKGFGIPEILQFILDTSIAVDISLLSAWLYDRVKGKEVKRVIINRRVITEITEQGIRQVLEEEIRSPK